MPTVWPKVVGEKPCQDPAKPHRPERGWYFPRSENSRNASRGKGLNVAFQGVQTRRMAAVCLTEGVASSAAFAGSTYTATNLGPGIANAINNSGYIAGELTTTNGTSEPVIWSPSGAVTVLQNVGELGGDQVLGINSAGYAVGEAQIGTGWDAVLWSPNGTATVLQDVGGRGYSQAIGINDAGDVGGVLRNG